MQEQHSNMDKGNMATWSIAGNIHLFVVIHKQVLEVMALVDAWRAQLLEVLDG